MISPSEFAGLRAFVAVGRALSFSRAAEALGLSASALSQSVRSLERELGEPLLHRSTRSVSLTDAGRALLASVEPPLRELSAGLDAVRSAAPEVRGTVRVHAFRTAAAVHLAPVLARLAAEYPFVTVDVTLDDAVIDPAASGFDAAIRLGEVIEQDMVAVRLGGMLRQLVVASPAYVEAHGTPETPAGLLGHRCILWRWPGRSATYDWEFAEGGRWFTVRPKGTLVVSEREFAVQAALHGAGITMASEPLVAAHLASGRLVPMLEAWCAEYPGFFICYPQHRTVSRCLRVLIDALTAPRKPEPPAQPGFKAAKTSS